MPIFLVLGSIAILILSESLTPIMIFAGSLLALASLPFLALPIITVKISKDMRYCDKNTGLEAATLLTSAGAVPVPAAKQSGLGLASYTLPLAKDHLPQSLTSDLLVLEVSGSTLTKS